MEGIYTFARYLRKNSQVLPNPLGSKFIRHFSNIKKRINQRIATSCEDEYNYDDDDDYDVSGDVLKVTIITTFPQYCSFLLSTLKSSQLYFTSLHFH